MSGMELDKACLPSHVVRQGRWRRDDNEQGQVKKGLFNDEERSCHDGGEGEARRFHAL